MVERQTGIETDKKTGRSKGMLIDGEAGKNREGKKSGMHIDW